MGIVPGNGSAPVFQRRQVDDFPFIDLRPVDGQLAIDTQTRDTAVGMQADAQVGPGLRRFHGKIMLLVRAESMYRQQLAPGRQSIGFLPAVTGLDRYRGRVVSGEMPGIDLETPNAAGATELQDRPILAAVASAAGFPAVHPLAVVVVLAVDEAGRPGLKHALGRSEEFVADRDHP